MVAKVADPTVASKPGTDPRKDGNAIVATTIWPSASAGKLIRIEDGIVNCPGEVAAAQTKFPPREKPAIRT